MNCYQRGSNGRSPQKRDAECSIGAIGFIIRQKSASALSISLKQYERNIA
jgi:hypothetical protein